MSMTTSKISKVLAAANDVGGLAELQRIVNGLVAIEVGPTPRVAETVPTTFADEAHRQLDGIWTSNRHVEPHDRIVWAVRQVLRDGKQSATRADILGKLPTATRPQHVTVVLRELVAKKQLVRMGSNRRDASYVLPTAA